MRISGVGCADAIVVAIDQKESVDLVKIADTVIVRVPLGGIRAVELLVVVEEAIQVGIGQRRIGVREVTGRPIHVNLPPPLHLVKIAQ